MTKFFRNFFADPMKKKLFLIILVSVLVIGAVVVAVILGGKSEDGNDSFIEKLRGETTTEASPAITTPSITLQPDSETTQSGSSIEVVNRDTTPGYGGLIRP